MPPINPVAVSAGIIAVSVAVAAAIAVYESPEIRRMAEDLRRRIALALQSLGEGIPQDESNDINREPVFNRPEDAEGFMVSRGGRVDGDADVVADDETRRRQREELMYWNRMRLQKQKQEEREKDLQRATGDAAAAAGIHMSSLSGPQSQPSTKTSFDQFMRPDRNADRGTYVVNTGADVGYTEPEDPLNGGLVRRRWTGSVRGLNASVYANPFGDEYGIEMDEQHTVGSSTVSNPTTSEASEGRAAAFDSETAYMAPDRDEILSDIYNATEPDTGASIPAAAPNSLDSVFDPLPTILERAQSEHGKPAPSEVPTSELFFDATSATTPTVEQSEPSLLLERALAQNDEYVTAGRQEDERNDDNGNNEDVTNDAFSSIQAWAQNSSATGFYSPLPVTPARSVVMSEPEIISDGQLTPVESVSTWGDDVSVIGADESQEQDGIPEVVVVAPSEEGAGAGNHNDTASQTSATEGRYYDVLSEDEDGEGVLTPTSWSEVGSVVSGSDASVHAGRV